MPGPTDLSVVLITGKFLGLDGLVSVVESHPRHTSAQGADHVSVLSSVVGAKIRHSRPRAEVLAPTWGRVRDVPVRGLDLCRLFVLSRRVVQLDGTAQIVDRDPTLSRVHP